MDMRRFGIEKGEVSYFGALPAERSRLGSGALFISPNTGIESGEISGFDKI